MSNVRELTGKPIGTITKVVTAVATIPTSTWTVLSASVLRAAGRIEIFNSTGAILALSTGVAGSEDSHILPYTILTGGSTFLVPLEIPGGKPLSVKALDVTADSGILALNLFG